MLYFWWNWQETHFPLAHVRVKVAKTCFPFVCLSVTDKLHTFLWSLFSKHTKKKLISTIFIEFEGKHIFHPLPIFCVKIQFSLAYHLKQKCQEPLLPLTYYYEWRGVYILQTYYVKSNNFIYVVIGSIF